jgi:hypothetical protein
LLKSLSDTQPDCGFASGPVDVHVYFEGSAHVVVDVDVDWDDVAVTVVVDVVNVVVVAVVTFVVDAVVVLGEQFPDRHW